MSIGGGGQGANANVGFKGGAGQHLVIVVNGVPYKIKLEDP